MPIGDQGQNEMTYDVDIVFCIDGTGSMGPVIDEAKERMADFPRLLSEGMEDADKPMGQLRVKLITFRDLNVDTDALTEAGFFTVPDQMSDFLEAINNLEARGGGDEPENALDAVARAMQSDWCETGWKRRHLIVVFTDASAIALDTGKHVSGVPADLKTLQEWWENGVPGGNLEFSSRRMVIFAPEMYPWNLIANWNAVNYKTSVAGKGMTGIDMDDIVDKIVKSIAANAPGQ